MARMISWTAVGLAGAMLAGCGGDGNKAAPGGALVEPAAPGASDTAGGADEGPARLGAGEPTEGLHASNADRPRVATPAPRASVEEFRPPWWIDEPESAGGVVRVGATGEGDDSLEARGKAVRAAASALRDQMGRDPGASETERYTIVQLADGRYRAFILMSAKP